MAEQLQAIQRRIKSIESTEKITNAMQLVAAAKLKQATNRFSYSRNHLLPLVNQLREAIDQENFPKDPSFYTNKKTVIDDNKEIAPSLTIVITGCKGMCGSYNSSILKELDALESMTTFLPLGLRGYEYVKNHDGFLIEDYLVDIAKNSDIVDDEASIRARFKDYYEKPAEEHSYEDIRNLAKKIISRQHAGEIAEVHMVYAKYRNTMAFDVINHMILPVYNLPDNSSITTYIIELLALSIYGAIGEAALNEYSARRLAMKNASDNAEEILSNLEMKYHRARQAHITDELIEIISGTESQQAQKKETEKKK